MAEPRPLVAPVTTATRPARSGMPVPASATGSDDRLAAVDDQGGTGDEAGVVGQQEAHGGGELVGGGDPLLDVALTERRGALLQVALPASQHDGLGHAGLRAARSDDVDANFGT